MCCISILFVTFAAAIRNYDIIYQLKLNKKDMKRKDYQKPTMMVVQLQQTGMLMTSGAVERNIGVEDYKWQNETEE